MHRLIATAFLLSALPALADEPAAITTDRGAYLVGPADLLLGPIVRAARWSADGRYLLMTQDAMSVPRQALEAVLKDGRPVGRPTGEVSIVLVDVAERNSRRIWSGPASAAPQVECDWLAGSTTALASIATTEAADATAGAEAIRRRRLIRISAATMQSKPVLASNGEGFVAMTFDPFKPRAIVMDMAIAPSGRPDDGRKRWMLVDSTSGPRELFSSGSRQAPGTMTFGPTGEILAAFRQAGEGPATVRWVRVDPATLALRDVAAPGPSRAVERSMPITVVRSEERVRRGGAEGKVGVLWLESASAGERSRAMLCADGDWAQVAPDRRHVLWCARGAAWLAPLVEVPLERYIAMRDEARRSELMMRGKMVALAVMMYVQDHEFGLPPTDQVPGAILPYLKDASAAEGFVYEIGGGKLADHAVPATTVMGYLSGPGGRAVVYLDGHVEWRADGS
jgi:hypothetical protein